MSYQRGLTLLELLVVLVILSLVTVSVVLSVRDDPATRLERETDQLIARLEAARAQARTQQQALQWRPVEGGYVIGTETFRWQDPQTQTNLQVGNDVQAQTLLLGPEPILPVVRLQLQIGAQRVTVRTDGLRPFEVER